MFTFFKNNNTNNPKGRQKSSNSNHDDPNQKSINKNIHSKGQSQNSPKGLPGDIIRLPNHVIQQLLHQQDGKRQQKQRIQFQKQTTIEEHQNHSSLQNSPKLRSQIFEEQQKNSKTLKQNQDQMVQQKTQQPEFTKINYIEQQKPQDNTKNDNQQKLSQLSSPTTKKNHPKNNIQKQNLQNKKVSQINNPISSSPNNLEPIINSIIDILTHQIQSQLTEQPLQPSLKQQLLTKKLKPQTLKFINEYNKQYYQKYLIDTKQKYNDLVQQSTNVFGKARKIATLIDQFIMSINLFFESQELLIPAKEIQKGIADLNPEKTQKYVNYLIKIFQSNFQEVIEKRVKIVKMGLEKQIREQQKLRKQQQNQLKQFKQTFKQKQSLFYQQTLKFSQKEQTIQSLKKQINQLNQKINTVSTISKSSTQDLNSQMALVKRQLERSKKEVQQLSQKIRKQEKMLGQKDALLEQKDEQTEKLGQIIKKVKQLQNQGIQSMIGQIQTKERMFQQKIQKYNKQVIILQSKLKQVQQEKNNETKQKQKLRQELIKLTKQIEQLKAKQKIEEIKSQRQNPSKAQINDEDLQVQNSQSSSSTKNKHRSESKSNIYLEQKQPIDLSLLVNKQILAHLFLSFDDQSKQWSIRNNIRTQIHILLDIKNGHYQGRSDIKATKKSEATANRSDKHIKNDNADGNSSKKIAYKLQGQQNVINQNLATTNINKTKNNTNNQGSFIGKLFGW